MISGWVCLASVITVVVLLEGCRRRDETPLQTLIHFPRRFLPRSRDARRSRRGDILPPPPVAAEPNAADAPPPGSGDLIPVFRTEAEPQRATAEHPSAAADDLEHSRRRPA